MAIWSLVLSILTLGGVGSVAGIMLGISARRRIVKISERDAGLAFAGIVFGVITLLHSRPIECPGHANAARALALRQNTPGYPDDARRLPAY